MKKLFSFSVIMLLLGLSASNKSRQPSVAQGSKNELISSMDSLERSSMRLQEGTIRLNKSIQKIH